MNPHGVSGLLLVSWISLCLGGPALAATRDDCSKIQAAQFNPLKYSTPSCYYLPTSSSSIAAVNACLLEIQQLSNEVSASWSRAYAAAKTAKERCFAEANKDALQRADETVRAAAQGSIIGQGQAYLNGEAVFGNAQSLTRAREVAALVSGLHQELFGSVDADVRSFASDPTGNTIGVRQDGRWAYLAHPPNLAQVTAERQRLNKDNEAIEARRTADAQAMATAAARPEGDSYAGDNAIDPTTFLSGSAFQPSYRPRSRTYANPVPTSQPARPVSSSSQAANQLPVSRNGCGGVNGDPRAGVADLRTGRCETANPRP